MSEHCEKPTTVLIILKRVHKSHYQKVQRFEHGGPKKLARFCPSHAKGRMTHTQNFLDDCLINMIGNSSQNKNQRTKESWPRGWAINLWLRNKPMFPWIFLFCFGV